MESIYSWVFVIFLDDGYVYTLWIDTYLEVTNRMKFLQKIVDDLNHIIMSLYMAFLKDLNSTNSYL
jgi:hypothetical protein